MGPSSDRGGVQATLEGGNVTDVTFVETAPLKWQLSKYADEYDTDSENDFPRREDEDIPLITVSRFRRPIRAHFRLDFEVTLTVDISNNLIEKETKEYFFPIIYRSQSQSTHCKTKHKTDKLC